MPGVIPALLKLKAAGFRFVMVSNQDGLGTDSFPTADFEGPQNLLLDILRSQGIEFDAIHIDPTLPEDQAPTRKPGIGMLLDYLADASLDRTQSAVIGDRETDLTLAANMGLRGFRVGPEGEDWATTASRILGTPRTATVKRQTRETGISVAVNLDQARPVKIDTGIGFFRSYARPDRQPRGIQSRTRLSRRSRGRRTPHRGRLRPGAGPGTGPGPE